MEMIMMVMRRMLEVTVLQVNSWEMTLMMRNYKCLGLVPRDWKRQMD